MGGTLRSAPPRQLCQKRRLRVRRANENIILRLHQLLPPDIVVITTLTLTWHGNLKGDCGLNQGKLSASSARVQTTPRSPPRNRQETTLQVYFAKASSREHLNALGPKWPQ